MGNPELMAMVCKQSQSMQAENPELLKLLRRQTSGSLSLPSPTTPASGTTLQLQGGMSQESLSEALSNMVIEDTQIPETQLEDTLKAPSEKPDSAVQ